MVILSHMFYSALSIDSETRNLLWTEYVVCCSKSRLDVYIHDYFVKRNLHATARAFQAESRVPRDTVGKIRSKQISRKIVIFFHSLVFSSLMVFFFLTLLLYVYFSQPLILLVVFWWNGGQSFGISLLPELIRKTQTVLHLKLGCVSEHFVAFFILSFSFKSKGSKIWGWVRNVDRIFS